MIKRISTSKISRSLSHLYCYMCTVQCQVCWCHLHAILGLGIYSASAFELEWPSWLYLDSSDFWGKSRKDSGCLGHKVSRYLLPVPTFVF